MNHILFSCPGNHTKAAWKAARELLDKAGIKQPPVMDLGEIITCAIIKLPDEDEVKTTKGQSRLYRLININTAWTLWKIRNERVIGETQITEAQLLNKLRVGLNKQLIIDQMTLTHGKLSKKRWMAKKRLVLGTWDPVLAYRNSLPDDWIGHNGVLKPLGLNGGRSPTLVKAKTYTKYFLVPEQHNIQQGHVTPPRSRDRANEG
ncbi:hypothetical protein DL93DRAFT_2103056, partial [Clavulina sp. PMI_390]